MTVLTTTTTSKIVPSKGLTRPSMKNETVAAVTSVKTGRSRRKIARLRMTIGHTNATVPKKGTDETPTKAKKGKAKSKNKK